jgi:hypothetical protein
MNMGVQHFELDKKHVGSYRLRRVCFEKLIVAYDAIPSVDAPRELFCWLATHRLLGKWAGLTSNSQAMELASESPSY